VRKLGGINPLRGCGKLPGWDPSHRRLSPSSPSSSSVDMIMHTRIMHVYALSSYAWSCQLDHAKLSIFKVSVTKNNDNKQSRKWARLEMIRIDSVTASSELTMKTKVDIIMSLSAGFAFVLCRRDFGQRKQQMWENSLHSRHDGASGKYWRCIGKIVNSSCIAVKMTLGLRCVRLSKTKKLTRTLASWLSGWTDLRNERSTTA